MKKQRPNDDNSWKISPAFLLIPLAALLFQGCAFFSADTTIKVFVVDNATLIQEDVARRYVIKQLNATAYGVRLREVTSDVKKVFEYNELYVKIIEKGSAYSVNISNYCDETQASERFLPLHIKNYYTNLEKAKKIWAALVSLGAKPCDRI